MTKLCLVLNGKKAGRPEVREAVQTVRGEGHDVQVRVTWEAGDAGKGMIVGGSETEATDGQAGAAERNMGSEIHFISPFE